MSGISEQPQLLVRISRLFGAEVENYRETLTPDHMIHASVPEILLLSNRPPCSREPPPQPTPPSTATGALPVQFPHRRGWHTDQSFRRPPPDVSLFYAVTPAPKGQGQTLFADAVAAYEALPTATKSKIANLDGLHALLGTGRSEQSVRAGEPVTPVLDHQRSQRQPLVRLHPVTAERALYLCESGQMDWHDGPVVGLQPGVAGDGAALIYALMSHCTQPEFTYVHEWSQSDLVVYDNRNLLHSATWYDSASHTRLMWRTTVSGNPAGRMTVSRRAGYRMTTLIAWQGWAKAVGIAPLKHPARPYDYQPTAAPSMRGSEPAMSAPVFGLRAITWPPPNRERS